jgi:Fe-Mn family superoxide dismutase
MTYCDHSNQEKYPFILPDLPYHKDALAPYLTAEAFDYHHGKHHQAYVTNLNKLLEENHHLHNTDLETLIAKSYKNDDALFNNAAQIWNHSFFWHSMKKNGGGEAVGNLLEKIKHDFGSYQEFAEQFKQITVSQFGSGWGWLVYNPMKAKLEILKTSNAHTPITEGLYPIIACDVWEHAYYIDYRNKRVDYVSIFLEHLVNWDFAEMNFNRARS